MKKLILVLAVFCLIGCEQQKLSFVSEEFMQSVLPQIKAVKENSKHKWILVDIEYLKNGMDNFWILKCKHCGKTDRVFDDWLIDGYIDDYGIGRKGYFTREQIEKLRKTGIISERVYEAIFK